MSETDQSFAGVERAFSMARHWHDQIELTEHRGSTASTDGIPLPELESRFEHARRALEGRLAECDPSNVDDERALAEVRRVVANDWATEPDGHPLYLAFGAAAAGLTFEGASIDRLGLLSRLGTEGDPEKRRRLFLALEPIWDSVGEGGPYRELIGETRALWQAEGSPVDRQISAVGLDHEGLRDGLNAILATWRDAHAVDPVEPWDLFYQRGEAGRRLAHLLSNDMLSIARRFAADVGADVDRLGIRFDLEPRPGKSPVAFCTFGHRAIELDKHKLATQPWVFATYREPSFDGLGELIHETGHALHIAAIDTRPSFFDWPDADGFSEALADLIALEVYEPDWQRRYLGGAASEADCLQAKYGPIILDILWSMFELILIEDPAAYPNQMWTELTHRYLNVRPHPEWSWWAMRGQLFSDPGYMSSYAVAAVLAADLRLRCRELKGAFWQGGEDWYPWLSNHLFRFGRGLPSGQVLSEFLGRSPSPQALAADLEGSP